MIEANLDYHLAQGVDFVLVTDHAGARAMGDSGKVAASRYARSVQSQRLCSLLAAVAVGSDVGSLPNSGESGREASGRCPWWVFSGELDG